MLLGSVLLLTSLLDVFDRYEYCLDLCYQSFVCEITKTLFRMIYVERRELYLGDFTKNKRDFIQNNMNIL